MRYGSALRRAVMAGLLALLAFGVSFPGTAKLGLGGPAMAQDVLSVDQFYDELAPYGEWVYHPAYGYVWLPRSVPENWRPYTVGRWISTDEYGWYWDSPEPFAWAVYHYGRWGFDPAYGWYWVPGDTWAPAWVQWRYGTDYVGWAPLEPDGYRGYAYGGPAAYAPPPAMDSWVFVRPRYLTAPVIDRYVLPLGDVSIALNLSPNVYRPEFHNGNVYNYGMPRDRWSRITHQHVAPRRIYRGNQRAYPRDWARRDHDRDLYVYAPGVRKGAHPRKPPKTVSHRPSRARNQGRPTHNLANAAQRKAPPWAARDNGRLPDARGHPGVVNPNLRGPHPGAADQRAKWKQHGGGEHHANKRQSKGKEHKPEVAKGKPGHGKPGKDEAARDNAAKAKAGRARPRNANAAKADKARAAKAKPAHANAGKANAQAAKVRANKAKAAKAKAKPAKAKALAPQAKKTAAAKPRAGGNGHRGGKGGGDGKHGGGNRAAACKANPNLPVCQRRGG
jgi:hypothetical protein